MRRILFFLFAAILSWPVMAQSEKIRMAVFDPSSSGTAIDEGTKIAIREIISSTIVNTGQHEIVERSLLEKVMQEQKFSQSGAVDDTQMTEIGKLAGANKVIVSVVTLTGGRNMLSIKMIDVKTANVERQKVKVVKSGELLDIVEPMTSELVNGEPYLNNGGTITEITSEEFNTTAKFDSSVNIDRNPKEGEIVLYMAPGYNPAKEKHKEDPITVIFDKEQIGGGTLSEGFYIKIKDTKPGKHKITFGSKYRGSATSLKIDSTEKRFYEFMINRWVYLGTNMYSVILKEAH